MLAKPHRLAKAPDIARVYKRGTYGAAAGLLSVKATPSGRSHARVAVVVGKKISKRAVVRNRIRRRILGVLESNWATVRAGYDIVISVHSDISELPADKLQAHITGALERARAI